jgi:hypothetical protein
MEKIIIMMLKKTSGLLDWREIMAHDVFISYSTKDKTIADAVCAKLEENKIRVWIAPRDVAAGSNFGESIIRAINTCKVFVLIWSANTNTSNHILNEINQAFDHGITIIPFRIQDIQPTDEMRYYFGRTHWLDAINPPLENHINTLRDTILVNLGRELQPAAPAPVLEQSPAVVVKPADELRREEKPVIEKPEAIKPPVISSLPEKSRKTDPDIQPKKAAPGKLKKYLPFAAGGLVLLTLVILFISGVFKGSPPAEDAEPLVSQMAAITPTKTIRPTATATPIPAWVTESSVWAEPILAAVNDLPPDFLDDFSLGETAWIYTDDGNEMDPGCYDPDNLKQDITDGKMILSLVDCQVAGLRVPDMQYANYVLQLEVNFQDSPLGLEFRTWGKSPSVEEINHGFFIQKSGSWGYSVSKHDESIKEDRGNIKFDSSKPVTITIINQSPIFLVYLDSTPVTFYNAPEAYPGPSGLDFTVNSWARIPIEPLSLELDNVKIWDLDRLDITNYFQKSFLVDVAIEFTEHILGVVKNSPPNLADDFSQNDQGWLFTQYEVANKDILCSKVDGTRVNITDGSMKFGLDPSCQQGILYHPSMRYANYVLQMDVNFEQTSGEFLFRKWYPFERYNELNFDFNPYRWAFTLVKNGDSIERIEGKINIDSSKPVTVTIISQSPKFLAYLNSILVVSYDNLEMGHGSESMDFIMTSESSKSSEVFELDNIKFWDLDRIE